MNVPFLMVGSRVRRGSFQVTPGVERAGESQGPGSFFGGLASMKLTASSPLILFRWKQHHIESSQQAATLPDTKSSTLKNDGK